MVETREWVSRAELMRKLSWTLGIDLEDLEGVRSLEFYKTGVEVSIGWGQPKFIPWKRKRKGIGSVLVDEREFDEDQEMLL